MVFLNEIESRKLIYETGEMMESHAPANECFINDALYHGKLIRAAPHILYIVLHLIYVRFR